MSILRKVVSLISAFPMIHDYDGEVLGLQELINKEAAIGGRVFGPVSEGNHREFCYLGNQVWAWNETTQDTLTGAKTTLKTRYEIRNDVVVKTQDGQQPVYASLEESRNLAIATNQYLKLIKQHIYSAPAEVL